MPKFPNDPHPHNPLGEATKRQILPIDAVAPDAENVPKTTSALDSALENVRKQLSDKLS